MIDHPFKFVRVADQFQNNPSFVRRDVSAPDVGDNIVLMPDVVDYRLGDALRREKSSALLNLPYVQSLPKMMSQIQR